MTQNHLLTSVAVAGALTATGAVATTTTAHADETTPAQTSQQTSAQQQLDNLKHQQTQAENTMADNNAKAIQEAQTQTDQQTAKLNAQLTTAKAQQASDQQTALTNGQQQINANTQAQIDQENASYNQAVKTQTVANEQALANASQHIVTPAQKQEQLNQAAQQYQNDQAKLNATNQADLAKLKASHDVDVHNLNAQITANQTQAQQAHDQRVKDATAQVDGQINATQTAVDHAQTKLDASNKAVNAAQTTVNTASDAVKHDQTLVNNAQAAVNAQTSTTTNDSIDNLKEGQHLTYNQALQLIDKIYPRIKLNPAFVEALKAGKDTDDINPGEFVSDGTYDIPDGLNFDLGYNANGSLDAKSSKLLSIYIIKTLNYMRQQIGTLPLQINDKAINEATWITDQYTKQNWIIDAGHDMTTIHQAMAKYNLENIGECLGGGLGNNNKKYLNTKVNTAFNLTIQYLYSSILSMITQDWNNGNKNGHAKAMLGLSVSQGKNNEFFAYNSDASNIDLSHFEFMSFADPADAAVSDSLDYVPNQVDATAKANLAKTQQQLAADQAKLNQTQAALTAAQQQANNDQNALNDAKAKLATLKSNRDLNINTLAGNAAPDNAHVTQLKQQLAAVETKYNNDVKHANEQFVANKNKLEQDYQAKITQIKVQPESNNDLKAQLDAKLAALRKNHETKLANIKADADQKLTVLKQQVAKLDDDKINAIQSQINQLQLELTNKKHQLDQQLTNLKNQHAIEYQQLHDKLFTKNDPSAAAKGQQDHYTTDHGQEVVLKPDTKDDSSETEKVEVVSTSFNKGVTNSSVHMTREQYRKLPQTGNNNSLAVIALGVISSMFGISLVAKKREQ
ncbi:SEC10/PgrA surface exclusion domain-containing protein [Limosilactobacillus sp. STM2_1]|uniref:SEC10/PgrA surface exclusion domain-containing protein n=1 Tax=Limosilactobacillus rudii TaxID=2759755 RepID=A0A7W3YNT4_9LACO|nr:SEC10/PgrA surface exclusion domain-containing protein [Limosilactobacillus rudii]MBB1080467.1 SEC10/PgrA surface exclusion domain-containing protein [Limosilactobacillus rudii]MBB1098493.1 SEC10/PgrA surface exclusion domain-containing protein [Limosilactobacillus rudii]MCD7135501.1 SEC10/PgrA surface exclusion domain-containing protein [Limosilactobacillus rudii]